MKSTTYPTYRGFPWFNTETGCMEYGIQTKRAPGKKWQHMAEDGVPLIFKTPIERAQKIQALRKQDAAREAKA